MSDSPLTWLTIPEVMQLLGKSDKSIRRMIERGELTAEKQRTATGQEWRIDPATLPDTAGQVPEPINQVTDTAGQVPDIIPTIEPDRNGQVLDTGGQGAGHLPEAVLNQFEQRLARVEGALVADFAQKLDERLSSLPSREDLSAAVQQAASGVAQDTLKPLLEELAARDERHAAEAIEREKRHTQEREELAAAMLEERERHRHEVEAIRRLIEEQQQKKKGILQRWFGE